ncbi:MAG: transcription termination factor Rho [Myxococcota bacterium]|nr:transcription termination factor Rho [Myxococcota bacterium]
MSIDITSMRLKSISELVETAHSIGLDNAANLSRQELVFEIVRHQGSASRSTAGAGVLEILPDGFGFLRSQECNYAPGPDDIYVSPSQIRRFNLRTGDLVGGQIRAPKEGERYFALIKIESINDAQPEGTRTKPVFDVLTPVRPLSRIQFTNGVENVTARLMDSYLPMGFGQRVAVVAPPRTERFAFFKDLIHGIRSNHPSAKVLVLLLDERPEEVTALTRSVDAEVLYSTFDEPAARHVQVTDMALERAKRMAESGNDVVLFVDSLSRLARASHAANPAGGKMMNSLVDIAALQCVRRVFGAARCLEEGGSLTLFATLLVGSTFDEVVAEDLLVAANGVIRLDDELANREHHPALDLWGSSTGARENFLSGEELDAVKTRRRGLKGDAKQDLEKAIQSTK